MKENDWGFSAFKEWAVSETHVFVRDFCLNSKFMMMGKPYSGDPVYILGNSEYRTWIYSQ